MYGTLHKKVWLQVREENMLLASLVDAERERLSPFLRKVVLEFQQVLIEPSLNAQW